MERGSININVIQRREVFSYGTRKGHDIQSIHEIGPLCVELIKAAPARLEGQQLLVLFAVIK